MNVFSNKNTQIFSDKLLQVTPEPLGLGSNPGTILCFLLMVLVRTA